MTLVADYTAARDPAQLKAAGFAGAVRYIAPPDRKYDWKRVTPGERDSLLGAGMLLWLVFESYAARALEGAQAGVDDAKTAAQAARSLGCPDDVPVFLACDTDATADQARPYFAGAASVRPCLGGYGGRKVTAPLLADGTIRFAWQTCAWSMPPTVRRGSTGDAVAVLQRALGIAATGVFDAVTETAVRYFQSASRLAVDGVAGPNTWDALGVPIDPSSHMYQRYRKTTAMPGDYDEDVLLKPIPTWGGSQVSSQVPQPPKPKPESISEADDMPIYQVTDGPAKDSQVYDYGFGPVHISGPESAELSAAGVRVVRVSGATFANRFKGVR